MVLFFPHVVSIAMPRKSPLLTEEVLVNSKRDIALLGRTGELSRRLNAIISSYEHSISAVAAIYNTTHKTIHLWIKNYKERGIEGLRTRAGRGRKRLLTAEDIEAISKEISSNSAVTIHKLRTWIKEELGKDISKSTCHNVMRQSGYSYKTARKKHYKSDDNKQDEFKKN